MNKITMIYQKKLELHVFQAFYIKIRYTQRELFPLSVWLQNFGPGTTDHCGLSCRGTEQTVRNAPRPPANSFLGLLTEAALWVGGGHLGRAAVAGRTRRRRRRGRPRPAAAAAHAEVAVG